MFKNILVPLDGSAMAEAALPAAAFLSKKFNAKVTLFHVVEKNAPREVHGQPHLKNAEEAEAYLRDTARQAFEEGLPVAAHVHTTEVDNVAESIVEHADELDHDVIVMCSHGRGKALHLLLGSIAQKIVAKGSLPVLLIHPGKDGALPAFSCTALLLPLDGNPDHAQALPLAKELAKVCGSFLHLAVVIPHRGALSGNSAVTSRLLPGTMTELLEMAIQDADDYLRQQVEELVREGFTASAHVLRGDPATVIGDAARQLEVDLVVMATHGKSGMEALWSGSVTHKVSSLSRVPLLLIPVGKK
ncbi:MAG: universal stress protein [Thermodesulfovibrionales bacterium]